MQRKLAIVLVLFFFSWMLPSCATTKKEEAAPIMEEKPRASYHDFEDVQIPSELKIDKKNSFVYTSSRFKVGQLTFEGRVESDSLAAFFQNNMPKDGWRQISILKFRDIMLVFLKEERACVIIIKENFVNTILEVRVGPIDQASSPVKGSQPR